MIVVVVPPRGQAAEALVRQLLPSQIVLVTATCCYSFFTVGDDAPAEPFAFADVDGKPLTEYRTFDTLDSARAWTHDDTNRRNAKAGRS
jgi:hypothetical protein